MFKFKKDLSMIISSNSLKIFIVSTLTVLLFVGCLPWFKNGKKSYDISYKPDWKAQFNLQKTKSENEFDERIYNS